jgi:hypothetical protein
MAHALIAFREGRELDEDGAGFSGAMILAQGLGNLQGMVDAYVAVHKKR